MSRCVVCGAKITNPFPIVLFESERTGKPMYGCDKCAQHDLALSNGSDSASVKKAVDYFYTYLEDVDDNEVREHLTGLITGTTGSSSKKPAKHEPESDRQKPSFAEQPTKRETMSEPRKDFSPEQTTETKATSGWITGLRFVAWLGFIGIILGGCSIALPFFVLSPLSGVLIIAASVVLAFISMAGIMVFLDMASDIKAIKNALSGKK